MTLPTFRYHPDPVASGSVVASDGKCRCCKKSRGYLYTGPVYAEDDLDDALCPWCIADGAAADKYDATFVDSEALPDSASEEVSEEILTRTPGFNSWQGEQWPACCNEPAAFVMPAGINELRAYNREWEGFALNHIIYDMKISGGAATRLLDSLNRDSGPTIFVFRCLHCEGPKFYIDRP